MGLFSNFHNMQEFLGSVSQFAVLGMVRSQRIDDETNGLLKKLAIALFIPVVTSIATAVVTSKVLEEQVRQIKEESGRLSTEIRRIDDKLESHKEMMARWAIEHERNGRK